jgi:alkenylglycerophosphocholine hydrolase
MYVWLVLALLSAALEAIAVAKDLRNVEYVSKPAVMVFLFIWLYTTTGLQGNAFWFGLGILFSLAGDMLLVFQLDRLFIPGLIAFLFAQISYIAGFRQELATVTVWSFILLVFLAVNVGRLMRRMIGGMRARGHNRLVVPVLVYGTVISIMLYAALSTLSNPAWTMSAAFFVSTGAFLFSASDTMLAWNKFISPIGSGRVMSIILYQLGQIGLIAGVISQLG